ncbi:luciferase family protein [Aeromicrobium ginsengisoli]|uniref:Phospholipase n=1 Tax=Aeromicrobium ginsengisoli TaxID=363867 RepID=A0A5M4FEZ7_9ACTN|nr:luciferase family protein [Aeromicrobium ginsengisoli]KAA1397927.1 phospholipase [Aeromicrobium ginsengisoli]
MRPLAPRHGPRPETTSKIPHSQIDQQPVDSRYLDGVIDEAANWPGVSLGESGISVEGARALMLTDDATGGPAEAFMVGSEFCHGHAQGDHSLHLTLPVELARSGAEAGWLEPHFLALTGQLPPTHVMLYAPRDHDEAAIGLELVHTSYQFALGVLAWASTTAPSEDQS